MQAIESPGPRGAVADHVDEARRATEDSLETFVELQDTQTTAGTLTREDDLCLLVTLINRQLNYLLYGTPEVALEPQMSLKELSEYVGKEGGRLGLCV